MNQPKTNVNNPASNNNASVETPVRVVLFMTMPASSDVPVPAATPASTLPLGPATFAERVLDSCARAGVREGDLLTALAGQPITAREDLTTAFYTVAPGTPLVVDVRRGEQPLRLSLSAARPPKGLGVRVLVDTLGLAVAEDRGALVVESVERGSRSARAGFAPGDRLIAANGQRLRDLEQLGHEVLRSLDRGSLYLVVQRGRYAYNLNLPL